MSSSSPNPNSLVSSLTLLINKENFYEFKIFLEKYKLLLNCTDLSSGSSHKNDHIIHLKFQTHPIIWCNFEKYVGIMYSNNTSNKQLYSVIEYTENKVINMQDWNFKFAMIKN
jgi:hypothetical protein